MKVFITREIPEAGIQILKKKGFEVSVYKKDNPIPHKELIKRVNDCDALLGSHEPFRDCVIVVQLRELILKLHYY